MEALKVFLSSLAFNLTCKLLNTKIETYLLSWIKCWKYTIVHCFTTGTYWQQMSSALSYLDLTCHTPCWQIVRSHQEKKSESRDSVFHMLDAPDFEDRIKSGENREVVGHTISKGISVERDRDNKASPTRGNWRQSLPYTVRRCRNGLATCALSHSFRTLPPNRNPNLVWVNSWIKHFNL